jgi:uncharacterized glyoxalase superfamily protein PhnB
MSDNTILLTGSERDAYIAERFSTTPLEAESHDAEVTMQAQSEFETWYDAKSEDMQALIDEISDRTYFIIDEDEYDAFIEELANYGITDASQFEDRFYGECEGYGDEITAEFSEQLVDECGYNIEPEFIRGCIDWQLVWYSALRFDYNEVEFKGNTYFFHNI